MLVRRCVTFTISPLLPQVVIVDEIGTEAEALACRTIAERGVVLIGTAHGQLLDNLIKNPSLCDLVGGIQAVTLGDEEAAKRGTQKTVSGCVYSMVVSGWCFCWVRMSAQVMMSGDEALQLREMRWSTAVLSFLYGCVESGACVE
jgi:hypothetical protein